MWNRLWIAKNNRKCSIKRPPSNEAPLLEAAKCLWNARRTGAGGGGAVTPDSSDRDGDMDDRMREK